LKSRILHKKKVFLLFFGASLLFIFMTTQSSAQDSYGVDIPGLIDSVISDISDAIWDVDAGTGLVPAFVLKIDLFIQVIFILLVFGGIIKAISKA